MQTIEWEETMVHRGHTYTMFVTVEYEVNGGFLRATEMDPADYPEVVLLKVSVDSVSNEDDGPMDIVSLTNQYVAGFDLQRSDICDKIFNGLKEGAE